MLHTNPVAASFPVRDHQLAVGDAPRLANLILPRWASTLEAKLLLSLIAEERPDRTRVNTVTFDGNPASFGYRGKNAAKLRALFDKAFDDMLIAFDGGEDGREGLIRFHREQNSDALIARVLEDRS